LKLFFVRLQQTEDVELDPARPELRVVYDPDLAPPSPTASVFTNENTLNNMTAAWQYDEAFRVDVRRPSLGDFILYLIHSVPLFKLSGHLKGRFARVAVQDRLIALAPGYQNW
jgi:hypothetical protein